MLNKRTWLDKMNGQSCFGQSPHFAYRSFNAPSASLYLISPPITLSHRPVEYSRTPTSLRLIPSSILLIHSALPIRHRSCLNRCEQSDYHSQCHCVCVRSAQTIWSDCRRAQSPTGLARHLQNVLICQKKTIRPLNRVAAISLNRGQCVYRSSVFHNHMVFPSPKPYAGLMNFLILVLLFLL